jgi:hypothetical protein
MWRIVTAVAVARVVGMSDILRWVFASADTPMIQCKLSNWCGTKGLLALGSVAVRSAAVAQSSLLLLLLLLLLLCGLPVRGSGPVGRPLRPVA